MSQESSHPRRRVAVLVDDGSNPFELACMTEVLGIDRPEAGGLLYDVRLCALDTHTTMRQSFFVMTGTADLRAVDEADTVIVPNRPDVLRPHPAEVLDALRRAHRRGARLVGMCSGAFTLAEAGLLDGRAATVHWQWADRFRAVHPTVELRPDVLFVDEGDVLTAAGSACALDLALHLVGLDHGADTAAAVARRLVFGPHRLGGQQQFVETPLPPGSGRGRLASTLEWAAAHLDGRLDVVSLAAHAGMSRAALHRRFRTELGVTPHAWVHAQRIAHARRLLETTDQPVDHVARQAGLGTSTTLRAHLRAATGLSPRDYRRLHAPHDARSRTPERSPGR